MLATSVVPYPPGIPMLMPGESTGPDDGPYLSYLRALQEWDARFPGFGHDTHGVENRTASSTCSVLKKRAARREGVRANANRATMMPRSVKAPTIPIPFHRLLKIVAIVDPANAADEGSARPHGGGAVSKSK